MKCIKERRTIIILPLFLFPVLHILAYGNKGSIDDGIAVALESDVPEVLLAPPQPPHGSIEELADGDVLMTMEEYVNRQQENVIPLA